MSASFQFVAVPAERYASLFEASDAELSAQGARRMVVDARPGYPCRVSLADAEVGETVILLPHAHQEGPSPYQATGPIFVRQHAATAQPQVGEIPRMFHHRLLSVRGYDAEAMMIAAEVVPGAELESTIQRLFADESVRYLHIHNARPGCFNCVVNRA
jgi:hypothetical protein